MNINFDSVFNWLGLVRDDITSWYQVVAVITIVITVWLIDRRVGARLSTRIAGSASVKKLSLNAIQRLFAPIIALGLFIVAQQVFEALNYNNDIIDFAIPLATSLAVIRLTVYFLRKAFPLTPLLKTWENIFVITVWLLFAMHIVGWLPDFIKSLDSIAFTAGKSRISLLIIIKAVASVAMFIILALWISALIERRLANTAELSTYLRIGISKTIRVVLLILATLLALDLIGIDLTALTVLGGALGVGIGFGLQRIVSNFISGFILLFDRSIRPGDVITINNSFGWVKELRARYVVIKDRDGIDTLIPNENLITSQVINWSYTDKNIRIKMPIQVSYGDDPGYVLDLMLEVANSYARVLKDPPAVGRLMGFGDNGIDLELRLWIDDPQNGVNNIRSDIYLAIWDKFKEQGVTIPFPQRDVYIKSQPGK